MADKDLKQLYILVVGKQLFLTEKESPDDNPGNILGLHETMTTNRHNENQWREMEGCNLTVSANISFKVELI